MSNSVVTIAEKLARVGDFIMFYLNFSAKFISADEVFIPCFIALLQRCYDNKVATHLFCYQKKRYYLNIDSNSAYNVNVIFFMRLIITYIIMYKKCISLYIN